MPMIDALVSELEQESATTRRLMGLPADKLGWRPHRKSFTLGQLALHIAGIAPGLAAMAAKDASESPGFDQREANSKDEVLQALDGGLEEAKAILGRMDDRRLAAPWKLTRGEEVLMTIPRLALLRSFMLNQHYHHRGQLTVYLRELDVPLPPVYGPTADEALFA